MPLRLRLALWYGGLTGLVVVLVSLFAYALHTRAHYDELDRALAGAAEHLAEEYEAAPTAADRAAVLAVPIAPSMVARVYDRSGQVVVAGPNAATAPALDPRAIVDRPSGPAFDLVVGLAPSLQSVPAGQGAFGLATDAYGDRWRVYVLPVGRRFEYVVVALPLHDVDTSVAAFRQLVPVMAIGGAFVTFVGGLLLAGHALRPVAILTDTAGAIAHSRNLNRRVPVGNPSDELGQLAATFNDMLASLERASQAQQRFVSDASHELRAPLTAIQANLELIERQPDLGPAERREAIGEAGREARRLTQLVADLLALARADAGVEIRRQTVELDRVLLEAFTQGRHLARGQQLELGALEPSMVEGDPDRLKQLLLAVLDNAIKYTQPGGRVRLELRQVDGMAEIVIADTGVGIPPADLPRVFERFYRADPARSRDPGGTGLGLPIAQWITEQHGGEIHLDSEPDRGTTATIRLPRIDRPASGRRHSRMC